MESLVKTSSRLYLWGEVRQSEGEDHYRRGEQGLRSQDIRKNFYLNTTSTKNYDSRNTRNTEKEPGTKITRKYWGDVLSSTIYNSQDMEAL